MGTKSLSVGIGGALVLATAAFAQPTSFEDLGSPAFAAPATVVAHAHNFAAGEIFWYKMTVPDVGAAQARYLDITTSFAPAPAFSDADSMIEMFDGVGTPLATGFDDDDGPGFASSLSFGLASPVRPNGTGVGHNGRDGSLAAGTYWLAVFGFGDGFSDVNWFESTDSTATGNITTTFSFGGSTAPTNPTGLMGYAPINGVEQCGLDSAVLVQVTPGANPASSGVTVTADLTQLGMSATEQLFDDGAHGDGPAGDGIFGVQTNLTGAIPEGAYTIAFTVADAQARSTSGTGEVRVDNAGDLPATAKKQSDGGTTISGFGGFLDVDMHAICVADANAFGASVVGGAAFDTELFLFDATGAGVAMNDDDPVTGVLQSNITGFPLPGGGLHYLAICSYNGDPVNSVPEFIWEDAPFDTVRAPDAVVTGGTVVAGWAGQITNAGGAYTITLANATTVCGGDLDNDGDFSNGGTPDCGVDINDLLFFLGGFEAGDVAVDLDDGNGNGVKDCATDINDLLFFLTHFEAGC